jgi:hypothetical protein
MLLRRITQHLRDENWVAVSLDLFVVIIGILIAFQVDGCAEVRRSAGLERDYLERLRSDLETETAQFKEIVDRTQVRIAQANLLEAAIGSPDDVAARPVYFVRAMEQVTWRSYPVITAYTYGELLSSGRMTLLRSEDLRQSLSEYYTELEESRRLGLGEDDQEKFRDLTVGLLSAAQLSGIEDRERYDLEVSADEAVSIAREFATRVEAHAWLARLVKYQVLMRARAEEYIEDARNLISSIDEFLSSGS